MKAKSIMTCCTMTDSFVDFTKKNSKQLSYSFVRNFSSIPSEIRKILSQILVSKNMLYEIFPGPNSLTVVSNYLSQRKQRVKLGSKFSDL